MKIVFTIGDINGIGIEVLLKATSQNTHWFEEHYFAILANTAILQYIVNKYFTHLCTIKDNYIVFNDNSACKIEIIEIKHPDVLHIAKEVKIGNLEFHTGNISQFAGTIALNSITEATQLTVSSGFDAIVTLPVSKSAIHLYNKNFIGHTEAITQLCRKNQTLVIKKHIGTTIKLAKQSLMILFNDKLLVALATTHTPIFKVNKQITSKKLRTLFKILNNSLKKDFKIENPRIAVLGLNPHASDNGMFGKEEKDIIIPAIEVMRRKGLNINGAFSADGFFASKSYTEYDGVIAMYHDQGLIPLKMLSDCGGVNFTANLPIVRTSPSHGTAFEIAGKDIANAQSMQAAINAAISIARNRKSKNNT